MEARLSKIFVTDCEGPLTKNDNAAELAEAFIPHGDSFFAKLSLYDDYLAEVVRKPGYKAGDTLRLILPFFKAFGLDHTSMTKFSRNNIEMIPGADCVLRDVSELIPAYIVSTSYSPYIKAVCDAMAFPFRNAYCTYVNLDDYPLPEGEKSILKDIHADILDLPEFSIPSDAQSPEDISGEDIKTIEKLDAIFWSELPRMDIYRIMEEVNPIGGREKAAAVEAISATEGVGIRDVVYVGDSITDVDAFRLVNAAGGITISFNGNDWAVREASFAVTSATALPIGWLATLFVNRGHRGFQNLTMSHVTDENRQTISDFSCRVRKEVRTEKIGSLG